VNCFGVGTKKLKIMEMAEKTSPSMSNTNTRYACEHVLDDLADFDKICEHVNGNGRKRPIHPC
jgi:hypothetical protein